MCPECVTKVFEAKHLHGCANCFLRSFGTNYFKHRLTAFSHTQDPLSFVARARANTSPGTNSPIKKITKERNNKKKRRFRATRRGTSLEKIDSSILFDSLSRSERFHLRPESFARNLNIPRHTSPVLRYCRADWTETVPEYFSRFVYRSFLAKHISTRKDRRRRCHTQVDTHCVSSYLNQNLEINTRTTYPTMYA